MAKSKLTNTRKSTAGQPTRLLWYGAAAAVVLFIVIAFFVARATAVPFELTGGSKNPTIFLRNESTVNYELTYTGSGPAVLERVLPRIQLFTGQVLVADVQRVLIQVDGQELVLEEGYFPEGVELLLQPGEAFDIGVVFLAQELGWNRIYGFRIVYSIDGRSVDSELTLEEDYYIFVE
ncbi:MAG TPA: hypothetical protein VMN57_09055 [Anaerolineales bacterium]|nr:hypothetical protein [Anaerolineales bacterium]